MTLSMGIGILVLRLVIGLLFVGHGTQKLFGWFGGRGLSGTTRMFENLNVYPAKFWAWVTALSETLGGLGLAAGLITPLAAALIVGVMLVAITKVHWKNGLWNSNKGIEFPLVNLVTAGFIGFVGPGLYSIDALIKFDFSSELTFLLSLAVVLLGVAISQVSGELAPQGNTSQQQHQQTG